MQEFDLAFEHLSDKCRSCEDADIVYKNEKRFKKFFTAKLKEVEREAEHRGMDKLFLSIDKEFESFKISEAIGKILVQLKKEGE